MVETKNDYPTKEGDAKLSVESKKKAFDFKPKVEMKYPKPVKEEPVTEFVTQTESIEPTTLTTIFETTFETTTITTDEEESVTTEKLPETNNKTQIPILIQGVPNLIATLDQLEPVSSTDVPTTTAKSPSSEIPTTVAKVSSSEIPTTTAKSPLPSESTTKEEELSTTIETTSSRARALNISAPEPTNSLHSNVTDLSDVSMDADDKEVEGTVNSFFKKKYHFYHNKIKIINKMYPEDN